MEAIDLRTARPGHSVRLLLLLDITSRPRLGGCPNVLITGSADTRETFQASSQAPPPGGAPRPSRLSLSAVLRSRPNGVSGSGELQREWQGVRWGCLGG